MDGLLHPLSFLFHIAFARDIFHNVGIMLTIFIEEFLGERFHGEGILDVFKRNAFALQGIEAANRRVIETVTLAKDVGVAFGGSALTLNVTYKRQPPQFAAIEYY